ncbi:MAG: flagellar motor protein MotB [Pseudomonadota bacterium]
MSDVFDLPPTRPLWLMTLADLALLLVGFLVLVQATSLDKAALAKGLRAGFDVEPAAPAMPVAAAALSGFASGSSMLPSSPAEVIGWARDAARDPRVRLRVAGSVDGAPGDVDPATGSGALLAADRARAVAAALLAARAIAPERLTIVNTASPGQRRVLVSLAFAGDPE